MADARGGAPRAPSHDESANARAKAIYVFAADKGGMSGYDKDAVNRIILELSAASAFTKQKLKQDAKVDIRIQSMRAVLARADAATRRASAAHVEQRIFELEQSRNLDRICAVVDFDMFYAAVEIRDRPELASKPVAVGGIGMITTSNYVARQWGVRSAMPGFVGAALCRRGPEFGMPNAELIFVPPDFSKYTQAMARDIFREYDPHMSSYSLDEAYLDLTEYGNLYIVRYCSMLSLLPTSPSNCLPLSCLHLDNVYTTATTTTNATCTQLLPLLLMRNTVHRRALVGTHSAARVNASGAALPPSATATWLSVPDAESEERSQRTLASDEEDFQPGQSDACPRESTPNSVCL
ncbi:hypothetical protein T492DRAFT_603687 [Pavlovales sp. CCMP2436]|nr:hypothetical protein T492DRAFT_603687 [Pavlovales sp. CCMP2436]